ncbi:MAG TPA: sulfotransferase [Pyrinomonadaceae bacterium]|nr:sulfotransferase [Pyrinomonadaceae bacterium]
MVLENDLKLFQNWIPIRIYWRENLPFVDWCWLGNERFTDSFFDSTIQHRLTKPFNQLFRHQTPLEFLGEIYETQKGIAPTGFIFHLSRCGSTLVSQMLAALEQNIVLSEPPPIDAILRLQIPDETKIEWLKWLVNAFAQPREHEKHFFIKFDSWNTLDLGLIKRAFPDVPWIFMYRNPVEVIVSHKRQPGMQMIPGQIQQLSAGISFEESLQMPPEEFCARILAKMSESALNFADDKRGKFINYTQLLEVFFAEILDHFKLDFNDEELEKMRFAAQFNAKNTGLPFAPDSESKRKEAGEIAINSAGKFADPLYEKLEEIRESKLFRS